MNILFVLLIAFFGSHTAVEGEKKASGLQPGEEVSAWEPIHIAGPHAGTKTCPVCTYLDAPALLVFAKNITEAGKLSKGLEEIAEQHQKGKLKVVLVVLEGSADDLRRFAKEQNLQRLMLCQPDPDRREKQLKTYKIDPAVANTVMLYQDYLVKKTWNSVTATTLPELKEAAAKYLP